MLSKDRRIKREEFPEISTPSFNWNGEVLRIKTIKKKNNISKFCIISPKKFYDTKVRRNRFKRRVFFEISQHLHKFDTNPHGYYLIFPVIHIKKISFSMIKNDIENFISYISK